jgi:hypothetical protein
MSVARVTTINFNTKEAADNTVQSYSTNAPTEFLEAEQLLQIRVDDTTVMAVSLYENNEAMERASAARTRRMDSKKDHFASVDTKVGTVELNHSNKN